MILSSMMCMVTGCEFSTEFPKIVFTLSSTHFHFILFLLVPSCCKWGEGSYQLAFGGDVVASGGSFGLNETKTFSTPAGKACYDVAVNLVLDDYPEDTRWDISREGAVVANSTVYTSGTTEDRVELCLPRGNYVFTIYDAYKDGE